MSTQPPKIFTAALVAHRAGRLEAAEAGYRETLRSFPDAHAPYQNLGALLRAQGRNHEAESLYREAILRCYPNSEFALHLGISRLEAGDYAEGFDLYEARRTTPGAATVPPLSFPEWDGSPISSLLLLPEQGLGDQIMFARYAGILQAAGIRVTLVCAPPLKRLFEPLSMQLLPADGNVLFEAHDAWALVGSLPRHLKTRIETVPPPAPLGMIRPRRGGIGVMARGNPKQPNDANRSMSLEGAAELARLPGAIDLAPESTGARDFRDTAEIIAGLDLVVTVCTSVANLAGSMDVPTWVLLPAIGACWRWSGRDGRSSWYPSARLYRQDAPGDWESVLQRVHAALPSHFGALP
jgi:hypothetical protein